MKHLAGREKSKYWVKDYSNFKPISDPESHYGKGQTGFNISESGKIYLSDNTPIQIGEGWRYPTHRYMIVGEGRDKTVFSGIYSFGFKEDPALWLYPDTEKYLNEEMKKGLASLIGVHSITKDTPVKSNTGRKTLFTLGEILKSEIKGGEDVK